MTNDALSQLYAFIQASTARVLLEKPSYEKRLHPSLQKLEGAFHSHMAAPSQASRLRTIAYSQALLPFLKGLDPKFQEDESHALLKQTLEETPLKNT